MDTLREMADAAFEARVIEKYGAEIAAEEAKAKAELAAKISAAVSDTESADTTTARGRNGVRRFLNAHFAGDDTGRIRAAGLFSAYQIAAAVSDLPALDLRQFPQTMDALGFLSKRNRTGGKVWTGLRERRDGDPPIFTEDEFEDENDCVTDDEVSSWRRSVPHCMTRKIEELKADLVYRERYYYTFTKRLNPSFEAQWDRIKELELLHIELWVRLQFEPTHPCLTQQDIREMRVILDRFDALANPPPPPDSFSIVGLPPLD